VINSSWNQVFYLISLLKAPWIHLATPDLPICFHTRGDGIHRIGVRWLGKLCTHQFQHEKKHDTSSICDKLECHHV
jgi:hypothetical protein